MANSESLLRPLVPHRDGQALHEVYGDDECCRHLPQSAFSSVEDTISKLESWTEGYEDSSWAIVARQDGDAIGRATLIQPTDDLDVWEIAVVIAPSWQGRGYAKKAAAEVVEIGFRILQARRIFADIDPDNTASIRLFEALDFQYEGRLRALWKTHIGVRDSLIYSRVSCDSLSQ